MGRPAPAQEITYQRRQPELTALHAAVRKHWAELERTARLENEGAGLPEFVCRAFERYLACGDLDKGFLRIRCGQCRKDQFVAFSCKVRGLCPSCDGKRMIEASTHLLDAVLPAVPYRQWVLSLPYDLRYLLAWNAKARSAVLSATMRAIDAFYRKLAKKRGLQGGKCAAFSVVQRFDGALRLDLHFHILYADGQFHDVDGKVRFVPARPLRPGDVEQVVTDIRKRVMRALETRGWLDDEEDDAFAAQDPALAACYKAAIADKKLLGDEAGEVIDRVRTAAAGEVRRHGRNCAQVGGFSLHANTRVGEKARAHLERLCRYLSRPAVAAGRIHERPDGKFKVEFKRVWSDGSCAKVLTGPELLCRMAAMVPLPKQPLLRYHGCFAPNAGLRAQVVKAGDKAPCGRQTQRVYREQAGEVRDEDPVAASTRLRWAVALQKAFKFDVLQCLCGGRKVVLAAIGEGEVAQKILAHVGLAGQVPGIEQVRGPPEDMWPAGLADDGTVLAVDEPWQDDVPAWVTA